MRLLPSTLFLVSLNGLIAQTPPPDSPSPSSAQPASPGPAQLSLDAPKSTPTPPSAASSNIHANADLISMDTGSDGRRRMLFSGHVKILGGGLVGTCDRMEIIGPEPAAKTTTASSTGIGSFSRVIATGNVTIRAENRTAFSEKAEIFPSATQPGKPDRIVLSGKPKITDGTQQITGGLITYTLGASQVEVEANPANPEDRPTIVLESFP